jgi:hypothetical protein
MTIGDRETKGEGDGGEWKLMPERREQHVPSSHLEVGRGTGR